MSRRRLLEALGAEKVTILPGIPFLFEALSAENGTFNLSSIRLVYSAGVSLRHSTFERFRDRFGFQVRQAYGCTEAGHVAFNRAADVDQIWDSVGTPVGDTKVKMRSIDPATGLDELMIHSSSVTKGYLGMSDLSAHSFPDGWFASGDIGRVDDEGNVFIRRRAKLVIEIAGHKVDPLEVEDVLLQNPGIAEAVVVGVDAGHSTQAIKAVVVPREDLRAEDVVAFCRARLASQKVPTIVELVDKIPKSASGKVLRGKLMDSRGG